MSELRSIEAFGGRVSDLAFRITVAEQQVQELSELLYRLAHAASAYVTTSGEHDHKASDDACQRLRSALSETQGTLLRIGSGQ